jgi:hypothetical protein
LQAWAVLVVVWAVAAGGLAQPALASDDGPPQYRYVPALATPRSALAQPAVLDEPTPLAEPKLFQVFLPLTVASPQAALDEVELVDFTYRLQEGDDLAMLALVWGVDSELMACVTRSGQEALSGLRPGTVIMIANPRTTALRSTCCWPSRGINWKARARCWSRAAGS